MGEGMSNKEIGRALRIGDSTVKNHVHNILEKLQVHRRGEAAVPQNLSIQRGVAGAASGVAGAEPVEPGGALDARGGAS
jgi:two-component system nitrate/nitrite response regulator NarL